MRLNDALIEKERYRGEPTTDDEGRTQWPICVVWDDEIPGFGIRIYPPVRGRPSRKDFIVTWRVGVKARTMAIGTYGADCTLRQARRAAREALDLARRGQDPIEARQRALGIGTNEDLASRFLFQHNAAAKKKPVPGGESAAGPPSVAGPEGVEPEGAGPVAVPGTPGAEAAAGDAAGQPAIAAGEPGAQAPAAAPEAAATAAGPQDSVSPALTAPEPAPSEQPTAAADPAGLAMPVAAPPQAFPSPAVPSQAAPPQVAPPEAAPPAETAHQVPVLPTVVAPPTVATPVAPKRGPTKVRLVPIPEGLHREIEQRARAAGLTVAAYLQGLIDREPAPPPPSAPATSEPRVKTGAGGPPKAGGTVESVVMPKNLFARIQASQTGDVSTVDGDALADEEPGRGRE